MKKNDIIKGNIIIYYMHEALERLVNYSLKTHSVDGVKSSEVTGVDIFEANGGISINFDLPSGEKKREWVAWSKIERQGITTREALSDALKK